MRSPRGDHLIVPVQTEFLALKGLERMIRTLVMIERSSQKPTPFTIVPTLFDRRTRASKATLSMLRATYPAVLWPGVVPVDTRFRDASAKGCPLTLERGPHGPLATRGVNAYEELLLSLSPELSWPSQATAKFTEDVSDIEPELALRTAGVSCLNM